MEFNTTRSNKKSSSKSIFDLSHSIKMILGSQQNANWLREIKFCRFSRFYLSFIVFRFSVASSFCQFPVFFFVRYQQDILTMMRINFCTHPLKSIKIIGTLKDCKNNQSSKFCKCVANSLIPLQRKMAAQKPLIPLGCGTAVA